MLDRRQFYINGQWVDPQAGSDLEVVNPSNETPCAVISLGGEADTNAAVEAASAAFHSWSTTPKDQRIAVLENVLKVYIDKLDQMAEAISLEMGAPIDMARSQQAMTGVGNIKGAIRAAKQFEFERMLGAHAPNDRIFYEAIGVVGLITPWNWPINQVTLKVIPALAAGCTMVLKPSEIAPLSSLLFADILHEAGVPAGVFNLVNGDGPGVGTQLSGHPDVDMISFTGSSRAGALVSKNAAETQKRVHLELGGKGANLVFADAYEAAVKHGAMHCFNNTGQSCNAPTRMLVQRERYDQAVAEAVAAAGKCQVAPADQSGRHMGPVVSKTQYDKIQGLIQKGIDEGARLVAGGTGKPEGLDKGYYVKPTVFADVDNSMTIAQEEIFGPVLSIIPFDTEEQAIQIANDTPYGLTNYIQSSDAERCRRVARRLRSGMVEMNGNSRGSGAPFGGVKASGNGREGGVWGLEEFLEVKSISGWQDKSA
ncbi:MAG: aldehyde dehydrogenase family protein [Gammaproteobacteria bacterium]